MSIESPAKYYKISESRNKGKLQGSILRVVSGRQLHSSDLESRGHQTSIAKQVAKRQGWTKLPKCRGKFTSTQSSTLRQSINRVVETRMQKLHFKKPKCRNYILRHPWSQNIYFSSTLSETGTGACVPLKQKSEPRKGKASDTVLRDLTEER